MATMPVAIGNGDLDLEIRPLSPSKRTFDERAELNGGGGGAFHEDLLGNIPIYTIWLRRFNEDREEALEEWFRFRKDALDQHDNFDTTLKDIEDELYTKQRDDGDEFSFLDMAAVLERRQRMDAIAVKVKGAEEPFAQISKVLEEFCSYLRNEEHRYKVVTMATSLRRRYFNIMQHLNTANHILQWLVPRLRKYLDSGNQVKTWLETMETRIQTLARDSKGSILYAEESIDELLDELMENKEVFEDFISNGKALENVHGNVKQVFRSDVAELLLDMSDVTERWDATCEMLENLLSEVTKERKAIELLKKTDVEKVDIKLEEEVQLCTCETPFKITKVGDGKYTFGTSKTVRLVRIHGQSIVVRVGGGWEYVYNFLMKVDPCRAKQYAGGSTRKMSAQVDGIQLNAGLTLTPLDNKDSAFTMSVQRLKKTSITPVGGSLSMDVEGEGVSRLKSMGRAMSIDDISLRKNRRSLRSSVSVDELDGCVDLCDIHDGVEGEEGNVTPLAPPVKGFRSRSKTSEDRPRKMSTPVPATVRNSRNTLNSSQTSNGRNTPNSTQTPVGKRNTFIPSSSGSKSSPSLKNNGPPTTKTSTANGRCNPSLKDTPSKNGTCEPNLNGDSSSPSCKSGTCASGIKKGSSTPNLKNGTAASTSGTCEQGLKNGKSPPNSGKAKSPPNQGNEASLKDGCDGMCGGKNGTPKTEKSLLKKFMKRDSRMYRSTDNLVQERQNSLDSIIERREKSSDDIVERRPKSSTSGRRVSLMDRQSLYAQKRNSIINEVSALD